MTLQETIERKLYETWCVFHGAEPNWGRSTPQSPSSFKTSRSLWTALAYTAIACVQEHATSEEAAMAAQSWRPISEDPPVGRTIIALYADGSGSTMFFRHTGGFIDQDGYDWDGGEFSDQYAFWTLLPSAFQFWCKQRADDPMRLKTGEFS